MRVLVTGSRSFDDGQPVDAFLNGLFFRPVEEPITVIEGGARGADSLAAFWASRRQRDGVSLETYRADWDRDGKAAGPIRNQRMIDEGKPDLCVAFVNKPWEASKGTADMVCRARKAGIQVYVIQAMGAE